MNQRISRRTFGKQLGLASAASLAATPASIARAEPVNGTISIDPDPVFDLSPALYMQFMEPLGATDGSVAFAWDDRRHNWKREVIRLTRELAPSMIRWGGCFSSYYRWQEGVGPRTQRTPMVNLLWGGHESNQVGTVEFVDFCQKVQADPLMCVNFESDGRERWMKDPFGRSRTAGPDEAAAWVSYCNDPENALRKGHAQTEPCRIPYWQIGNETSYDPNGFAVETAATKTVEFAHAMRQSDPSIKLIGWGDNGWAPRMIEVAGEHLQYIAFHHMYNPGSARDSVLRGTEYRKDPDHTWAELMDAWRPHAAKIARIREETDGLGIPLALTECHFALDGPNRCHVLSSWAAGVALARLLNVHTRNGDVLKIATAADFCGNTWQVNALMIGDRQPGHLMPVARVMQLYRAHVGQQAVTVTTAPSDLDVTASRTADTVYLHVVNTHRTRSVKAQFDIQKMQIASSAGFEIAADPSFEVWGEVRDGIAPREVTMSTDNGHTFPPASVSAIEIKVIPA